MPRVDRRALLRRAAAARRGLRTGALDPELALSHVVWPDKENDGLERFMRKQGRR